VPILHRTRILLVSSLVVLKLAVFVFTSSQFLGSKALICIEPFSTIGGDKASDSVYSLPNLADTKCLPGFVFTVF